VHYDDGITTKKAIVNDFSISVTTYTLDSLKAFTDYKINVSAVRYVGGNSSKPLEGANSSIIQNKTLAGSM